MQLNSILLAFCMWVNVIRINSFGVNYSVYVFNCNERSEKVYKKYILYVKSCSKRHILGIHMILDSKKCFQKIRKKN